jgi:hypothetical protein
MISHFVFQKKLLQVQKIGQKHKTLETMLELTFFSMSKLTVLDIQPF